MQLQASIRLKLTAADEIDNPKGLSVAQAYRASSYADGRVGKAREALQKLKDRIVDPNAPGNKKALADAKRSLAEARKEAAAANKLYRALDKQDKEAKKNAPKKPKRKPVFREPREPKTPVFNPYYYD